MSVRIDLKNDHLNFDHIIEYLKKKGIYRILVESGLILNKYLLENNYINDFYHFYSNNLFKNKGYLNAKFFFNKINNLKKNKRRILINLFKDNLDKYSIK